MRVFLALLFFFASVHRAGAAVVVNIDYTGDATYAPAFDNAKTVWESTLTGYQNGVVEFRSSGSSYFTGDIVSSVFIAASIAADDGLGGRLGQAGVDQVVQDQAGFLLSTDASMSFDSADIASLATAELNSLVLHEVGHALGFGSLWTQNGVYSNGTGGFTGAQANAAWQSEFNQIGTADVETEGGLGTAGAHWNENLNGDGLTGITDPLGRDMRDELMTGWLNPNAFISDMTVASFRDIGFTTRVTAVPEPGTVLLLTGLTVVGGVCRRRKRV